MLPVPSLPACGRSSEAPAGSTGRCGTSESGRVLLDRRIGCLVPAAAARLAAAPGGVPTERTKGRSARDSPSFYGGGIVIGRRRAPAPMHPVPLRPGVPDRPLAMHGRIRRPSRLRPAGVSRIPDSQVMPYKFFLLHL